MYDAATPVVRQVDSWSCSVASTTWALHSLAIPADYPVGMESAMLDAGLVSPSLGLLDASGGSLARWLRDTYGVPAENTDPISWDWLWAHAGGGALAIGGRAWCHWSGARAGGDGVVLLANPANGWQGVY